MADISKLSPDGGTTEYNLKDSTARANIGDLSELETTDKSDLVSAINEVVVEGFKYILTDTEPVQIDDGVIVFVYE